MPERASSMRQLVRFAVVGVLSNGAFYLVYLFLASQWLTPRQAMTVTYALAVINTFAFNRTWTFAHRGKMGGPFARYVAAYLIGYVVNFALLTILVDVYQLPHQAVQGFAVVTIAVLLFLLQKFWVFPARANSLPLAGNNGKGFPAP